MAVGGNRNDIESENFESSLEHFRWSEVEEKDRAWKDAPKGAMIKRCKAIIFFIVFECAS